MINSFPFSRSLKIALASACLGASSSLFAGVPVNINTADAVELSSALDGVGGSDRCLQVRKWFLYISRGLDPRTGNRSGDPVKKYRVYSA